MQIKLVQIGFVALLLSACGGGGSSEDSSLNQPENQIEFAASEAPLGISPGGIWVSQNAEGEPFSKLYIDETGKMFFEQINVVFEEFVMPLPDGIDIFVVDIGDFNSDLFAELFDPENDLGIIGFISPDSIPVNSSFSLFDSFPDPLFFAEIEEQLEDSFFRLGAGRFLSSDISGVTAEFSETVLSSVGVNGVTFSVCEMMGFLVEDASLNLSIECENSSGSIERESINFVPQTILECTIACFPQEPYEMASSLSSIAGSYAIPLFISEQPSISPTSSPIAFSALGEISGLLDFGPECSVSGQVSIIDPQFNLYDIEIALSDCEGDLSTQNGRVFTGFAISQFIGDEPSGIRIMLDSNDGLIPEVLSYSIPIMR